MVTGEPTGLDGPWRYYPRWRKPSNALGYRRDVGPLEVRMHRKRKDLAANQLRMGQVQLLRPEEREGGLQVCGNGVVNASFNATIEEVLAKRISMPAEHR